MKFSKNRLKKTCLDFMCGLCFFYLEKMLFCNFYYFCWL